MLKCDELKLKILDQLHGKSMTLGQLKKATKIAHHDTLINALDFLEAISLVKITEKKDKLRSKVVSLK